MSREAVAGDRRSIRVAVTPNGAAALLGAQDEMSDALERIFAHAREREAVIAALVDLDDALALRSQARLRDVRRDDTSGREAPR